MATNASQAEVVSRLEAKIAELEATIAKLKKDKKSKDKK